MKFSFFAFLISLWALSSSAPAKVHPIPRRVREADQLEAQADKNIPPPATQHISTNPEKLRQAANEVAALAESIAAEADQTTKGTVPKDLGSKLRELRSSQTSVHGIEPVN